MQRCESGVTGIMPVTQGISGLAPRVGEQTEGGEALPTIVKMNVEEWAEQCDSLPAAVAAACPWYALYTHSHCEQLVYEQLAAKGFHLFLPKMQVWSQRAGVRHRIAVPMFPGYLFLHSLVDSATYLRGTSGTRPRAHSGARVGQVGCRARRGNPCYLFRAAQQASHPPASVPAGGATGAHRAWPTQRRGGNLRGRESEQRAVSTFRGAAATECGSGGGLQRCGESVGVLVTWDGFRLPAALCL